MIYFSDKQSSDHTSQLLDEWTKLMNPYDLLELFKSLFKQFCETTGYIGDWPSASEEKETRFIVSEEVQTRFFDWVGQNTNFFDALGINFSDKQSLDALLRLVGKWKRMVEPFTLYFLFKQFCEATGYSGDLNDASKEIETRFYQWIIQNSVLLHQYWKYLEFNFQYSTNDVLEIGKSKFDSLREHCSDINVSSTFVINNDESFLHINNGIPLIVNKDGIAIPREQILLTHNPYFESEISDWYLIHNKNQKDISIGMFGRLEDEDRKKKINLLRDLSQKMTDDYVLTYDTDQGNYFCSLNSQRLSKKLSLSLK